MKEGITVSGCTHEYHKALQSWGLSFPAAMDRPRLDRGTRHQARSVCQVPRGKIPVEGDPVEVLECADPTSDAREPEVFLSASQARVKMPISTET